ncbi:uncharacterized protein L3040_000953 [Drepanopeziza brunnea f. sp. 'multigermtubi']|nr:hypothetical protein L3040_000953 [Drepanopeziza brunnea f. sp. 'multigermtubi']
MRRGRRRQRRGPVLARAVKARICLAENGARVLNAVPAAALAVVIPAHTLRFALTPTTSGSICVGGGGASARRSEAPSPESVRAGRAIGIGPRQSFGYIPAWGDLWQPFLNHAKGDKKAERFSYGKVRNQGRRLRGEELSPRFEDGVPKEVGWNGGLWQREEGGEGACAIVASKVGDAGDVEGSKPRGKKGLVLHVDTPGFVEKSQAGIEKEEGERVELELEKVATRKENTEAGATRLLHDDLISIMSNGSVRSTESPEPEDAARESARNSEVGVGDPQPATSTQDDAGMDLEADLEAALNAELFGNSDSEEEEKEGNGEEASKSKDFPQEEVHDEEQWGDCATADDYWQQFGHESTPVDGVTPRELQDEDVVMDDDDSSARTRLHFEQSQEVDAKGPPFILKVEPPDTETPDWSGHATEQAYWQQFEHNDKADIPQLHVHGGEETVDASDREEWGDYQTSDDYWAQFDKPSPRFVDSYHERQPGPEVKIP